MYSDQILTVLTRLGNPMAGGPGAWNKLSYRFGRLHICSGSSHQLTLFGSCGYAFVLLIWQLTLPLLCLPLCKHVKKPLVRRLKWSTTLFPPQTLTDELSSLNTPRSAVQSSIWLANHYNSHLLLSVVISGRHCHMDMQEELKLFH